MTVGIKENALRIMDFLFATQENEYLSGSAITNYTGLPPQDVNRAMELLTARYVVDCQKAFGTAPYKFYTVRLTGTGHLEVERRHEQQAKEERQNTQLEYLRDNKQFTSDVDRLLEQNMAVSVIVTDLDNFKAVNDTYGHAEGNRCLQKTIDIINSVIFGNGKLYRFGRGDEFMVVLPNRSLSNTKIVAEKIRSEIEAAKPGNTVRVTASLGVAASEQFKRCTADTLFDAADLAAIESKRKGKNHVT